MSKLNLNTSVYCTSQIMRAPPPIRKNRRNWIPLTFIKIKSKFSMKKCKRRWQLHKLHKTQYRQFKDKKYIKHCKKNKQKGSKNGDLTTSNDDSNVKKIHNDYELLTGVRIEDTFNLESQYLPESQTIKPLLVTSFRNGCSNSPNVTILQRNKLSKLKLSKRQYSLKSYNLKNSMRINHISISDVPDFQCSQTVRIIKKITQEHADVRVIFHNDNVVKNNYVQVDKMDNVKSLPSTELMTNKNTGDDVSPGSAMENKKKPKSFKRLMEILLNASHIND